MANPITQMEALADASAGYVQKIINGEVEATKETLQIARLATSAMGNYVRATSVKHNHERTVLRLADKLSESPEQMLTYIAAALPDAGFVRALTPPAEKSDVPD